MWPELWVRRFVTSPVTQTWPMSFSNRRRTFAVSSETVSTRRETCAGGNNSPKSHCDCAVLDIGGERFRNALDAPRFAGGLVNVNHRALQEDAVFGDGEPLRHVGDKSLDYRFDVAPKHALVRAGET